MVVRHERGRSQFLADHAGNSSFGRSVAASNSPTDDRLTATALADGTGDHVEIQAAIDALELGGGGTLRLAPGDYSLGAGLLFDANVRMRLVGYGARLRLPATVSGIKVKQGNVSGVRGVRIEGIVVDGQSNASTVGIELEDTNNAELVKVDIEGCTTGLLFDSQAASAFVEGTYIEDVLIRNCTTGWASSITSGTGSFAQTVARGLRISGCTTGLSFPNLSIFQRGHIEALVFIDTGQTAANIDCNVEDLSLDLMIEGAAGATGNTGLIIGTNATNTLQMFLKLLLTGTIATQANFNSKDVHYWSGGSQIIQSAGTAVFGYRRHGDSTDRLRFEGLTAGGRIQLGNGTLLDTRVYRNGVGVLGIDNLIALTALTFATLPTAVAGMQAYITDSTVTAFGATIAGGGANKVLAFYNGTNWTVAGA